MPLLQRERQKSVRLHGYFVVPASLNPTELGELRRACDIALDRARAESTENGHTTPKIGIFTEPSYFSHQPGALDRLTKFVGSARVCSLLEGLALEGEDDTPRLKNTDYYHEQTKRDWDGDWHRDSQFGQPDPELECRRILTTTSVHVRVALADDDRLEIVPGAHPRWDTPEELEIRKGSKRTSSAMPGATGVAMEAGDACVFHAWSIHRATYRRAPLRRTLDALYAFGGLPSRGTAPDKGPPYECHCAGSDVSLGTWERLPPDTAITAMAQQCGAPACPPKPTFACNLGLVCQDGANGGWTCSTAREPRVLCNGGAGGASCSCTTGATFTLPNTSKLTNDELVAAAWQASCGGSCVNAGDDPNTEWVCPGNTESSTGGGCVVETAGTCRDNHVYRAECEKDGNNISPCKCMVDGVVTKTVSTICVEAAFSCDFPKMQGEVGPRPMCPRTLMGPLTMTMDGPEARPEGCLIQTAGTCRDNHAHSAECPSPSEVSTCTCKIDGAATKTVNVKCSDAPTACGFPLQ